GGYLSLAGGLAGFLFLSLAVIRTLASGRRFLLICALVCAGAAGVVGTGIYAMRANLKIDRRLDMLMDFKNMRLQMWEAAMRQFQESPWIGTGARTYLYYGRKYRPDPGYDEDPIHAHNDYVELLAEYGVIGFLLMLGIV